MRTCIYWHRNDLRIHDNECLHIACRDYDMVIPLYIVDPHHYREVFGMFKKSGINRYRYLRDSIHDLRKNYKGLGGNLAIRYGKSDQILLDIISTLDITAIIYQEEPAYEEVADVRRVEKLLDDTSTELVPIWGRTLYHLEDIPFEPENIPLTSKAFRIKTSKNASPRDTITNPTKICVPNNFNWGKMPTEVQMGYSRHDIEMPEQNTHAAGETAALKRLQYYTYESELLTSYKWTRNRSLGMDYSSKLSPYLALGSLSPRKIYEVVKQYETDIKKNISTWWLIFEIVWRDFFIFKSLRVGEKMFYPGGIREKETKWNYDKVLFDRWRFASTGIPFLDAHHTEMNQTGFMSNRGRVNSASFLTRDYSIDWRWGAAWFEHCLIDYDVYANWMNWHTQTFEIYYTNPVHQALKYDKDGKYTLTWLPHLSRLPHSDYHAPWLYTDDELIELGILGYRRPTEIYKKWTRSINNIIKERKTDTA